MITTIRLLRLKAKGRGVRLGSQHLPALGRQPARAGYGPATAAAPRPELAEDLEPSAAWQAADMRPRAGRHSCGGGAL
jgi:hypothetical protein